MTLSSFLSERQPKSFGQKSEEFKETSEKSPKVFKKSSDKNPTASDKNPTASEKNPNPSDFSNYILRVFILSYELFFVILPSN